MQHETAIKNEPAVFLDHELDWFQRYMEAQFRRYFQNDPEPLPGPPDLPVVDQIRQSQPLSAYINLLVENKADSVDRMILALALMPLLRPQSLDLFFTKNAEFDRGFTEFGGLTGKKHSGFLPTIETALFLIAGDSSHLRLTSRHRFEPEYWLTRSQCLSFDRDGASEPFAAQGLLANSELLDLIMTGKRSDPVFGTRFPAKKLPTALTWDDLILDQYTQDQLLEVHAWLQFGDALLQQTAIGQRVKPGYRCLFYGPPGTGKTLTAALLGKLYNREVYRVDLSMVVSKYIGETEKNLENVFQQAEDKQWILFFDEADALFGKRTNVSDAHDRFANQEVSYLLQRVEDYPGMVLLATNLKNNLDEAFSRRFQAIVNFPMPAVAERLRLWEAGFEGSPLAGDVDLQLLAEGHEISGGSITNVVRYSALMSIAEARQMSPGTDSSCVADTSGGDMQLATISHAWILDGIQRELLKEGRKY
ncbi:ATP-dependent zinc metalloprotease FtsH [BD1-7 clade bacterium]|uniref:ATP-dependent zinc metalloprotease FtsH n=1 Tax=BD1-7 clade bacterium TaxID=2029982 RepID=A0A5S9QP22_9GAMM|nr:ATP-dependent zinc metalloprotease FtsH [BD1-7 clade bacterium]